MLDLRNIEQSESTIYIEKIVGSELNVLASHEWMHRTLCRGTLLATITDPFERLNEK
jgi:hypothetical protein